MGDDALAVGDKQARRQTTDHCRTGSHGNPVTPQKFTQARIPTHCPAGLADRTRFQKRADVVGQGIDRAIALFRLLAQCLQNDEVEVSRKGGIHAARRLGFCQAHRQFDGAMALRGNRVRRLARKQLVEHRTQRIDIACRCLSRTSDLFRAGECGRQDWLLREGLIHRGIDNFRDAEIEKLRFTGVFNQNVRGLEVAMNDEIAVRVGYCLAGFQEERQFAAHFRA